MRDLKYLAAYINPALAFIGMLSGGYWTFATVIFSFVFVPLTEPFLPKSKSNHSEFTKKSLLKNKFFDGLLYVNVFIIYGLIFQFGYLIYIDYPFSNNEWLGLILSLGIVVSSNGINVAHELGHRSGMLEKLLSKLLLLPALYTHFTIEHNRGHHLNVATDADPASARKNEILYIFWLRSAIGTYKNAWKLELSRLKRINKKYFSFSNEMIWNTLIQIFYLSAIYFYCGIFGLLSFIAIGIIAILMLESINYVEHYGLRRKRTPSGRYERVQSYHSWNANYHLGRIILYELTRHSDHHYIASKKYQVLDHHEDAPELPLGYPSSMLLAMIPPLWFLFMNKRIP